MLSDAAIKSKKTHLTRLLISTFIVALVLTLTAISYTLYVASQSPLENLLPDITSDTVELIMASNALQQRLFYAYIASSVVFFAALIFLLVIIKRLLVDPIKTLNNSLLDVNNASGNQKLVLPGFQCKEVDDIARQIEIFTQRNIELSSTNVELSTLSEKDGLTGLSNRRHLDQMIEIEFSRAIRYKQNLVFMMLDIDFFKKLNDNYGHAIGDECLIALGKQLLHFAMRPGDIAARYGGEEFMMLLPQTTLSDGLKHADRIRKSIMEIRVPVEDSGDTDAIGFTASIGVSELQYHGAKNPSELMTLADKALYNAKANGRNRCEAMPADQNQSLE